MGILSHRIYGNGERIIYILHGIFGMKDNWHHVAGKLGEKYTVVTCDARNHGHSFHDFKMHYQTMADDVLGLMHHLGHSEITLMGHSMGGKTAMTFAQNYPDQLSKLIVVDIALRSYPPGHLKYFEAFEKIDFSKIQSRTEADMAFIPYASDMTVRQFLLKNLEPIAGGGYQPKFNLAAIKAFYGESIGALQINKNAFLLPTLLVHGANSNYVSEKDKIDFLTAFPQSEFKTIDNAGHWVHADNPMAFITCIEQFIAN